jgi:hypothetical protein
LIKNNTAQDNTAVEFRKTAFATSVATRSSGTNTAGTKIGIKKGMKIGIINAVLQNPAAVLSHFIKT